MKTSIVFLAGAAVCVVLMTQYVSSQLICPLCTCPPTYQPVCARHKDTGNLRGFESLCTLRCTNKCRKNKYEFMGNGRCGKYKKTTTTTTTTTEEPVSLELGEPENTRLFKSLLLPPIDV